MDDLFGGFSKWANVKVVEGSTMSVSKETFFRGFNHLTNTWVPKLGLCLSADAAPRTEIQDVKVHAAFEIDHNRSSQELGGARRHNRSSAGEVTSSSKKTIEDSISGRRKSVCNILYRELSSNSLFSSVHRNNLPIETFKYSCLVTCNPCNGTGEVTCSTCNGHGKVDKWRNEIVGETEYRDSRGYVTRREPKYENRRYRENCTSCSGHGEKTCSRCGRDGENTYVETVDVFAKVNKFTHQWTKFSSTQWVNDYLHGSQRDFKLQDAGDWNIDKQVVKDLDNGTFTIELPGSISAGDCHSTMTSDYATSKGTLKTLGGLVYDCDHIYCAHAYQAANQAIEKNRLDVKSLSPLTSSKLFNACGESKDGGESLSSDTLTYRRMISKKSSKEMFKLLTLLKDRFKESRKKLSMTGILLRTLMLFFIVCLPLVAGARFLGTGVYENFSLVNIFSQFVVITESFSFSSYYMTPFTIIAIILFIPSILLMVIFGAKKNWTTKRILRWYWISAPLLAALFILFSRLPVMSAMTDPSILLETLPILDISVIALLGAILLTRKRSWGKQQAAANLYQSDVLMKKLDYQE
ncbi:MAG: hypothetical protein ACJAS1_001848 [Oleiphilaceae bacterium]|jgi:hypothetical protein